MHVNQLHKEAELAVQKGDVSKGINLMLAAIKLNPESSKLQEDIGVIYLHAQMNDLSIQAFDKALELEPDNAYRYSSRAFVKARFKDFDGAIEDYEKAIEMDPDDAITRNNLGLALEQKGYQKKAERQFNKSNDILGIQPKGKKRIHPDSVKMKIEFESRDKSIKPEGIDLTTTSSPKSQTSAVDKRSVTKETTGSVVKGVFTKKETFKEFIQFIKSGFKIKDNDKK